MIYYGEGICKTRGCGKNRRLRCARKKCRKALTSEQVGVLEKCPYCSGKIAEDASAYCDECYRERLRQKLRLRADSCCLECNRKHPRSKNGRCIIRNVRDKGLRKLLSTFTPDQIEEFRQTIRDASGAEMLALISEPNWRIVEAIRLENFADDPATQLADKIGRHSLIRQPSDKKVVRKKTTRKKYAPGSVTAKQWWRDIQRGAEAREAADIKSRKNSTPR